jgi:hypothetical protein
MDCPSQPITYSRLAPLLPDQSQHLAGVEVFAQHGHEKGNEGGRYTPPEKQFVQLYHRILDQPPSPYPSTVRVVSALPSRTLLGPEAPQDGLPSTE